MLYANSVVFATPRVSHLSTDLKQLPPDLPLPVSPANPSPWLRDAIVLQPYGHSEFTAITEADTRALRRKKEFGFNTIVVQSPDSHNTIATAGDKLTEKQFRAGLVAYRAAGYHTMLYTSVMALGLSPEFQSGAIAREHPNGAARYESVPLCADGETSAILARKGCRRFSTAK
ncbi:MAG TPA: hypothetical protein VHU84_14435 [Lacipirellulaceae bacterium]|nr:hypothetical protein [Lacipirellulaceae bacterium]